MNNVISLSDKPIKAGVIGHPIGHSLSPYIHGYWLDLYGINGSYEAIEVEPDQLENFLQSLYVEEFAGVNITLPYKEVALPLMDSVGAVEKTIGAINTVYVTEEGKLDGNNTDYYGFYKNLQDGASIATLKGKRAVMIGAGGAARAVSTALLLLCDMDELVIVNRTRKRAEALKYALDEQLAALGKAKKIIVADWEYRHQVLTHSALLVNSSSLGMHNQPALDLDLSALPTDAVVTDIVYTPLETDLLRTAKARGNITIDGLGMLLHQAVLGFHKWFGVEPAVTDELREYVLEKLSGR